MATTTAQGMREGDDEYDSDSEYTPLYDDDGEEYQRTAQETKGWNLFREIPQKTESGSMTSTSMFDKSVKIMKFLAYIVVFAFVLGAAAVAKGTLLFITSQLKKDRSVSHCNRALGLDQQFRTVLSFEEQLTWLWAVLIVFGVPEVGVFLRSVRICFFKTVKKPSAREFFAALLIETLQTVGVAMLLLIILPEMDVVKGAMLMNAMCFIPGLLTVLTRDKTHKRYPILIVIDVLAISAQVTAFVVWPILDDELILWTIPVACILVSIGWWETFISHVDKNSAGAFLVYLSDLQADLKLTRYYTHRFLSIWKICVFATCIMVSLHIQGDEPLAFFTSVGEAFSERLYVVEEILAAIPDSYDGMVDNVVTDTTFELSVYWPSALWVSLIQVASAYICFGAAKFACKILIQSFSFTFALSLVAPVTINLLIVFCGLRNANPCAFHGTIPDYLFFKNIPGYLMYSQGTYIAEEMAWVWLFWLVSQAWITVHTWQPRCERLAATDNLFAKPWYNGPLIDVSLLMNRVKDKDSDLPDGNKDADDLSAAGSIKKTDIKPSDAITRIYICGTMWHETKDEMIEFLKSLLRLDEDQSAHRVARKYFGANKPDYYELEAHIFMDDAFEVSDHSKFDAQVNKFVRCLVETIDEAASKVHYTNVRLRPPMKYPTPYGGRLVWTLPGKNKLICHLKDKTKIRHKKRWSQVMYMYYFLGHRLMDLPISVERKEMIAENTYLLALDGDIDFKPSALTSLVDLMKRDKNLGAACGRIHPVGSGFMAWYQMFEYAIGHWLQKATEHMIGCVLCSPGCFSLFRGKALMDDNVMKKYTFTSNEARHFVQYDQGEDRWLCTLLLQRGYRVEYCAASDSYTHCPERFDEFFNQRRRWVPSTMANIFDLLADSKRTVRSNDNISTLYIMYQIMLMVGTLLGPGTIFLMMVGAMNAITGMSNWNALLVNLIPISIFFLVCMTCKPEIQLLLANIITCLYAMFMMMVIVGIALQIVEDGWLAPTSIFFVATFGIFFITAALHPQEIICLAYIFVYYITIPSMYMLLIIYSLCNLNNVSWGTREEGVKKTAKQIEDEAAAAKEEQKKMDNKSIVSRFGKSEETSGTMEFGIAGLFRCLCCVNPNDHKEDLHLLQIANSLKKLEKRLDNLGAPSEPAEPTMRPFPTKLLRRDTLNMVPEERESVMTAELPREERTDLINPYWTEDTNLQKGEVEFLTTAEIEFWKDLIEAYLKPIDEKPEDKKRITLELKNLRNTMVFAFLMINALFVLTIFLLQLNQDQLHMQWPLGQRVFIAYDDDMNIVNIEREYLMLEPIGSLFLIFFGSVMIIQFTAMLLHRLGTLTHLLAAVELDWFITKRANDMTNHAHIEDNVVGIAKDLQKLNDDDLQTQRVDDDHVSRRKTVTNLENQRNARHGNFNLDTSFKKRMTIIRSDPDMAKRMPSLGANAAMRRNTLRALTARRDSVAERRRSQMQMQRDSVEDYIYERPSLTDIPGRASAVGFNNSYEPRSIDDDAGVPSAGRAPRRSTVWFKETSTYA